MKINIVIFITFLLSVPFLNFILLKPVAVNAQSTYMVNYTGSGFNPSTLTIDHGDTVIFANISSSFVEVQSDPHPIHTSYPPLNLGLISPGSSKSLEFVDLGTFGYHNHLNDAQKGTIIVVHPTPTPTPTSRPTQVPTNTPTPTNTCTKEGDANCDGKVDGFDYVIWWTNFGKNVTGGRSSGDFDNNGIVDGFDYVIWWLNFGS